MYVYVLLCVYYYSVQLLMHLTIWNLDCYRVPASRIRFCIFPRNKMMLIMNYYDNIKRR